MNAREAILDSIRQANGGTTNLPQAHAAWAELPRAYNHTGTLSPEATLHLLDDRLRDYDAHVLHCTAADIPRLATEALASRGLTRLLIPPAFPAELLPLNIEAVPDTGFTPAEFDTFTAVFTTSTVAIAETGTIVLSAQPGEGRRALSLVPDVHLVVVRTTDVVATVPEAFSRLAPLATLPLTFISGPSATADIEMTRIKGVHGPRFLHVFLTTD